MMLRDECGGPPHSDEETTHTGCASAQPLAGGCILNTPTTVSDGTLEAEATSGLIAGDSASTSVASEASLPADTAASEVFAVGENSTAGDIEPTDSPSACLSSKPASARKAKRARNEEATRNRDRHAARLAILKHGVALAMTSDRNAREHRHDLLAGAAMWVAEEEFNLVDFCAVAGLPCTKATRNNPGLAVIQGALPEIDRKLASKWAIALTFALRAGGGISGLRDFLDKEGIEGCVRLARKAKKGNAPARKSPLKIQDAPPLPEGTITITINVVNGRARFVGPTPAAISPPTPMTPLAPPGGDDGCVPASVTAPVRDDGGSLPRLRPEQPDVRCDDDVAGVPPSAEEVPAAA